MSKTETQPSSTKGQSKPGRTRTILKIAGYWLVYHGVLFHAMFLYEWFGYRAEVAAGTRQLVPFQELYFQEFATANVGFLICSLLILPIIVWDILKTTRAYFGPVVRFKIALGQMKEGEKVSPIGLRKKDSLKDLQDAFNEYLEIYHERRELWQESNAKTRSSVVESAPAPMEPESVLITVSPEIETIQDDTYFKLSETVEMTEFTEEEFQLLKSIDEIHQLCQAGLTPPENLNPNK